MPSVVLVGQQVDTAELRVRSTGAAWTAEVQECKDGVARLRLEPGPLGVLPELELGAPVDCLFGTPHGHFHAQAVIVSRRGAMVWLRIPPAGMHRERRRSMRVVGGFPVAFACNGTQGTGDCADISTGGMRLQATSALPVRAPIELSFRLPGEQAELKVRGAVVYTAPRAGSEGCDLGVEFADVSPGCRELLAAHCVAVRRP